MNNYLGSFIVSGFRRVVELCSAYRIKIIYCLLLWLGVLAIVRRVSFCQKGNHCGQNYSVRSSVQDDHFNGMSFEIMSQRSRDSFYSNCLSKIPYDRVYIRPTISKERENDFQVSSITSIIRPTYAANQFLPAPTLLYNVILWIHSHAHRPIGLQIYYIPCSI